MQCALAGPAWLTAQRDPEDLVKLLADFHDRCVGVITQAGGALGKRLDNGVLAYFGCPQADEHQAECAIRAALALLRAGGRLEGASADAPRIRVGIATGVVVVGGAFGASTELTASGESASLAAGLAGRAEPDTVLISSTTRRLVGELFRFEPHEPISLDGFAEPAAAWRVVGERAAADRFEALHGRDPAGLVGREEELALLSRRWEQAKAGDGCVALVAGEPGIGKSRLVKEVQKLTVVERGARLSYFCSPYHQNSAFHPIIGQLARAAGMSREDAPGSKLDKLAVLLSRSDASREDAGLLADMLSLPSDARYPVRELAPQQRRQKTLEALLRQIEVISRQTPVMMIFEDAHWSDPTTLEVFDRLVERIRTLRVLLLVTFQPEFAAPWIGRPHVTALTINRLAPREVAALIEGVTGGELLPANAEKYHPVMQERRFFLISRTSSCSKPRPTLSDRRYRRGSGRERYIPTRGNSLVASTSPSALAFAACHS